MSKEAVKKNENATADATKKNAELLEKMLKAIEANFSKREAKTMFNVYGNIASVTAKHARVFLKKEAFEAFEAYATEYIKNAKEAEAKAEKALAEAKAEAEEATTEKQKQTAEKAIAKAEKQKQTEKTCIENANMFAEAVKNASKNRKGPHTVAITVTADAIQFAALATALKAYDNSRQQKKREAEEAKSKAKEEAKKQSASEEAKSNDNSEAENAAA